MISERVDDSNLGSMLVVMMKMCGGVYFSRYRFDYRNMFRALISMIDQNKFLMARSCPSATETW